MKRLMKDLTLCYIRVTDVTTNIDREYRLIERIVIEKRPSRRHPGKKEMWICCCTLSQEFAGLLNRIPELKQLRLDVFNAIRSPLAQAIYLYIPSRAHHHSESQPFEITLTNLLEQVSFPVPAINWMRKKLFTQNRHSILKQLDGLETLSGDFRVRLAPTADHTDWKLQAWVERKKMQPRYQKEPSKLLAAYLKSGRSHELFSQALAHSTPLDGYETELLEAASVEIEKNRRFFEMTKALLLGPRFRSLLSEAKGDEIEGRKAGKNPTARLIHRIMEAIENLPCKPQ
jgi:hypothetical protein